MGILSECVNVLSPETFSFFWGRGFIGRSKGSAERSTGVRIQYIFFCGTTCEACSCVVFPVVPPAGPSLDFWPAFKATYGPGGGPHVTCYAMFPPSPKICPLMQQYITTRIPIKYAFARIQGTTMCGGGIHTRNKFIPIFVVLSKDE